MGRRTIHNGIKLTIRITALAALVFIFVLTAVQYRIHILNQWQRYTPIHQMKPLKSSDTILVVAPHSDDETLGCGGVMALANKTGAKVKIALITNGDGFRFAAARTYKTVRVTHQRMIDLAHMRQKETIAALKTLGIASSNITFLGYPDRGLAQLWENNWNPDKPYTSSATGFSSVRYDNSLSWNAPYCGESLKADLEHLLLTIKPTIVFIPHPSDNHPDHYATYCFVSSIIDQLVTDKRILPNRFKVYTYLVHRGDWPVEDNELNPVLSPPHFLAQGDTQWLSLPLPDEITRNKAEAIKCYRTQTNIEREFLSRFVRPNEIFGVVGLKVAAEAPSGYMGWQVNNSKWHGVVPVISDPVGDYVVADLSRGGDVRAIYVCTDKKRLFLRIDFAGKLSKRIKYSIALKNPESANDDSTQEMEINKLRNTKPDNMVWSYKQNTIQITLPLSSISNTNDLYIRVSTKLSGILVDSTGWRSIHLKRPYQPKSAPLNRN